MRTYLSHRADLEAPSSKRRLNVKDDDMRGRVVLRMAPTVGRRTRTRVHTTGGSTSEADRVRYGLFEGDSGIIPCRQGYTAKT